MGVAETNQPPNNTLIHSKLSYVCSKTWLFRKDEGWLAPDVFWELRTTIFLGEATYFGF